MKTRIALIIYSIISMLALMLMLSRENIFVVIALVIAFLLLGHRELWSLLRHHRLPVIDDRVRENLSSAMRVTGVFFFISSIIMIILVRFGIFQDIHAGQIISGQLVIVGIVYVIGYHYYDRVRPNLGERTARWLKRCLITTGFSLSTIALSITLHNLLSSWLGFEEAFFFILGLLVTPAVLIVSLLASLVIFLVGLMASFRRIE